jgi:hypothetical protein
MTSNDDSRRRLLETARFLTPTQWEALSQRDKLTIETALAEQEFANQPFLTHRQFAEHPDYCRLTLSPMVAAIMDAAEGIPVTTIDDATCERYFGCKLDQLPKRPARAIAGHAGGRGGKSSRLLATKALHAAWTVPVPTVAAGESPVALIVSSDLIFARQLLAYCVGYATESPVLSQAVVGTPNVDSFTIRRSDGVEVELRVRAPGVKGKGGRAFTLVVALLDEAAFFYDDSGVINDREIVRAVRPRLVPGGQLWMLSTPWVEGVGVLEETIQKHWGTHEGTLAFRRVGTRALNPTWDPDGEIEAQEREDDPDNAAREIDAEPLTAGSTHWFSREAIEAAFRDDLPQQSPYNATHAYAAAADTGFMRNSSALAMVEGFPARASNSSGTDSRCSRSGSRRRAPRSNRLRSPESSSRLAAGYATREIVVDSHEKQKVTEAMIASNATAITAPDKYEAYVHARQLLHQGRVELPRNARLRQQLRDVMGKPMPGGGTQISSPKRADGSHGDLVSAFVNALWRASKVKPPMKAGTVAVQSPQSWG